MPDSTLHTGSMAVDRYKMGPAFFRPACCQGETLHQVSSGQFEPRAMKAGKGAEGPDHVGKDASGVGK